MIYGVIALTFFTLAIVTQVFRIHLIKPVTCLLYGFTSTIMFIFQSGNWLPIFMLRYFFYIIGALLVVIVPFILLTLTVLMFNGELKHRSSWIKRIFIWLAGILIILFAGYSFWNVFYIKDLQISVIFGLYASIAIYLTSLFVSYLFLSRILNYPRTINKPQLLLVLGTDINDEGKIQSDLEKRLQKLVRYFQKLSPEHQKATYIVVSGGNPTEDGKTEADGMLTYLVDQGINKDQIIRESSARNTEENIRFSKTFIKNIGKNRETMVFSSSYHLPRISYYLQKYHISAKLKGARTSLIFWPFAVVREFLALLLLTKEISILYILYIITTELINLT